MVATSSEGYLAAGLFGVAASAVVLCAVVAVFVAGERTRAPLEDAKAWLLANNAVIMTVICVLLAAKMLGSGLDLVG